MKGVANINDRIFRLGMKKLEPRVQTEVLASQNSCFMRVSVMSHAAQGIRGSRLAERAQHRLTLAKKNKTNVSVTANGSTGFNPGPILNSCCRP